jgi:hypothetical protein
MPLARWMKSHLGTRRATRRCTTTNPGVESLEGRTMLSQTVQSVASAVAVVHAEKATPRVYPPANSSYWQPLLYINGKVLLPGPTIINRANISRLIQSPQLESFVMPPKGVAYLFYGNNDVSLYELQGRAQWHVVQEKSGRLYVRFDTFQGEMVPVILPGTVGEVVRNWTPASNDPAGNRVVIRTVLPNGALVFTKYEHLQSDIPVKVGDKVLPEVIGQQGSNIGLVGRTGSIPTPGPTNLTIVCWTPSGGGHYLQPFGTPHFMVLPNGAIVAVLPVTFGCSPDFIDTDSDGTSDDADMDDDDPGGMC